MITFLHSEQKMFIKGDKPIMYKYGWWSDCLNTNKIKLNLQIWNDEKARKPDFIQSETW